MTRAAKVYRCRKSLHTHRVTRLSGAGRRPKNRASFQLADPDSNLPLGNQLRSHLTASTKATQRDWLSDGTEYRDTPRVLSNV